MPIMTPSQAHIDRPLTNLTLAYAQDNSNFIADKVFPLVGVSKQSDKYYIFSRENMNRTGDVKKLAPRTEVERIGLQLSNSNYFAEVYGIGMDFDEQTLANADEQLNLRAQGSQTLINRMMIHREELFASTFFTSGVWTSGVAGVASSPSAGTSVYHWSDYANGTPLLDVQTARRTMQLVSGGYKPNTMVVGKEVRDKLINHPTILARLNGGATVTNTALVSDAKLAEMFEVERFLVMEAVHNTAVEGAAESNAFIGGKHALLTYTPSNAGLQTPASGLTFAWNNIPGANNLGITVESFSDDALKRQQVAEHIQVKMAYDMRVVGADLGYFFNGIVA